MFCLHQALSFGYKRSPLPPGSPHYDPDRRDGKGEPGGRGHCSRAADGRRNPGMASVAAGPPGIGHTGPGGGEIEGTTATSRNRERESEGPIESPTKA